MLAGGGFDPPTFGLWDQWNTSILPRLPVGVQIWNRTRTFTVTCTTLPLSYLDLLFVFNFIILLPDMGFDPMTNSLKGNHSSSWVNRVPILVIGGWFRSTDIGFDPLTFGLWDQCEFLYSTPLPEGVQIWNRTRTFTVRIDSTIE